MTGFVILVLCVALFAAAALLVDAWDDADRGWDRALELEARLAHLTARQDGVGR